MVQVDLVRTARQVYERGDFVESVDALVDEERASDGRYFVNMVALWITYTPSALQRVSGDRFGRWMFGEVPQHELSALEARLAAFEAELSEVERALGESMGVKRMRSTPDNDELLQGLHLIVNGRWQPCRPLRRPVDLGALLARDLVWSTSSADAIQHADSFVEVVGILEMPKCSVPQMLHSLSSLGCELRWSSRFIMLDYGGARSTLKRLESNWANQAYSISPFKRGREVVNRDAYDREQEAKAALSQIEDRAVRYGHYTSVVVARGQSRAEAKARVALVASALERAGFMIKVEGINRIEALLGSMPGHGVQNVRKPMVHSLHFSDLLPLGREWSGSETCPSPMFPEDSPALIQARSWGGSMFFLNLHQGDLGHTLVLGPSGAGKSTLLASIVSQWMRYAGSQVIVFDQGRSMAALTLARRDGAFFALGSEEGIRTCPLADIDSEEERAWAVDWVESLCTMQGVRLSPEQRQRIFLSMGELAESTSAFEERASRRTLTHFAAHIIDDDIKSALHYYTSGPGAMVLNGDSDRLKYARLTTLELERLIECDPRLVKPTLLYLFRQVERRLDGRPTLVVMDEAWRYLDDPVFEARLKAWLKKFRKRNCAVIFATQQLSDVATSRIGEVIFESCPTRILLPNEQATVAMKRLYRDVLSLSEEQVQLLSTIARKRWYMYVDSSHSRVFTLDLGPVARAFCGASTMDDLEMIWSLVRAHGFAWPVAWLQARGLEQAAERFVELELQRASRAAVMKSGSCTDQPAAESST
jgi:type IV secretion system protein VirB4